MMIAIKDFKMPRGCYECPFADESIRMDCDYYCQAVKEKPDVQYGLNKPDWCPLVDVPDMNVGNCSEFPNNSDCVSRRAAVEAIANQSRFSAEEIINICDKSVQDENGWLGGLKEAILAVLELPSAQPERKKGEWVYNSPVTMKCDQCGIIIKDWDWHRFKFCPSCGCDMRGEQDEQPS